MSRSEYCLEVYLLAEHLAVGILRVQFLADVRSQLGILVDPEIVHSNPKCSADHTEINRKKLVLVHCE